MSGVEDCTYLPAHTGARLSVLGVIDLYDLADEATGVAKIVLESVQDMLLKLALRMARDDYEDRRERQRQGIEPARQVGRCSDRKANTKVHERVVEGDVPNANVAGGSEGGVRVFDAKR